jgi:hypothetical protein
MLEKRFAGRSGCHIGEFFERFFRASGHQTEAVIYSGKKINKAGENYSTICSYDPVFICGLLRR